MLLARFAPLHNINLGGRELLPLLMEFGPELANYFEMDAERLARIINQGVDDPVKRVDARDIELLIMSTVQESYAYLRLKELTDREPEPQGIKAMVKRYIYEKYMTKDTPTVPTAVESAGG